MDAAACIGCGACVAVCKNASAMLFVSAKVSHLNLLPQGKAEKDRRALNMVKQMDAEGFGNCTVTGSCEAVCPKEISLEFHRQDEPRLRGGFAEGQGLTWAAENDTSRAFERTRPPGWSGIPSSYSPLRGFHPKRRIEIAGFCLFRHVLRVEGSNQVLLGQDPIFER